MNDRTAPLAPLSPQLIGRLTAQLGAPKTWSLPRNGALDMQISAWLIGKGEIATGESPRRITTVEIWITTRGRLLLFRRAFTEHGGSREGQSTSQFHETPEAAYAWLVADGKGKLGRASKQAWVDACQQFEPMRGMELAEEEEEMLDQLGEAGFMIPPNYEVLCRTCGKTFPFTDLVRIQGRDIAVNHLDEHVITIRSGHVSAACGSGPAPTQ